ncbi:hypothetical protein M2103_002432 [Ereboglobus sp. PH5-5]|uniref:hypothetical protein n=1 Tax=unclassified Ereboglobus TaxID=2626932 RepID=UPI0024050BEE|nr:MULTISPECIES: hypothetical protein [unclassified Ereboglobus]MDF9828327.1 hypothetical protein [Ereboglobus sp. PH5-10]MDF9834190.1 hypothetical protein [Ereboglobus sp. PH5-5]
MPDHPKINWQFQDLHAPSPNRDWVALQKLEADICLFYQQQAHYSHVMGDLYYGDVYSLPYWEMLSLEDLDGERLEFVQSGCLMILLAMSWELIDGSGSYLMPHVSEALAGVRASKPATSRVARLRQHVEDILSYLQDKRPSLSAVEEEREWFGFVDTSQWAHREFVFGYFRNWCDEFIKNPYYHGGTV